VTVSAFSLVIPVQHCIDYHCSLELVVEQKNLTDLTVVQLISLQSPCKYLTFFISRNLATN